MQKKLFPSLFVYGLPIAVIVGWWYLSFASLSTADSNSQINHLSTSRQKISIPEYFQYLSKIDRDELKNALSGNFSLMASLISEWDADAQILESQGHNNVQRLSRSDYARAHLISRQLKQLSGSLNDTIDNDDKTRYVLDDQGIPFKLDPAPRKFLPQTYISASFLLSLTKADQIVAIPHGMRGQTQLYPESLTRQIPLDIDRYNSEEIYQSKPDIAFVAYYSHPSTIQALRNQGIPVFTIDSINTLPEILGSIQKIGQVIHHPKEAELLSMFMKSAMLIFVPDGIKVLPFLGHWEQMIVHCPCHSISLFTTSPGRVVLKRDIE